MKSSQHLLLKIAAHFAKIISCRTFGTAAVALLAVAAVAGGADNAAYFARIDAAKAAGVDAMDKLVLECIADAQCDNDTLGWATVCLGKLDLVRALETLPAHEAARGRTHRDGLARYLFELPGALERAALWLRRHPDAAESDAIANSIALHLQWRDPSMARSWARRIKDEKKRSFTLALIE